MYDSLLNKCALFVSLAKHKDPNVNREYMRQYMSNRYHNKRNELIDMLGGKCVNCGSRKGLELDHIDRKKKKMRMADSHSVSDGALKKELRNIQLLCRKCHYKKSLESSDYNPRR